MANYNDETEKYRYTNLLEDENRSMNMQESIPSTYAYINNHGGFTDDFRLFHTDDKRGDLTYQLFLNGRPTFNDDDLNTLKVSWGNKGIYSYARTLLKANVTIDSGEKKSTYQALKLSVRNSPIT